MLQEDSVRNLQYDSDIRVAQPTRIDPISKNIVKLNFSLKCSGASVMFTSTTPVGLPVVGLNRFLARSNLRSV